jgi:hypothetical protein
MLSSLDYEILNIEGIHPTSSRTYKLLNTILLNTLWDVRYKHFAVCFSKSKGRVTMFCSVQRSEEDARIVGWFQVSQDICLWQIGLRPMI